MPEGKASVSARKEIIRALRVFRDREKWMGDGYCAFSITMRKIGRERKQVHVRILIKTQKNGIVRVCYIYLTCTFLHDLVRFLTGSLFPILVCYFLLLRTVLVYFPLNNIFFHKINGYSI